MTRIAGVNVIRTPCCGRKYATTAYASINFMAWEHWTDGQDHMGLAPPLDGLRHCSCGSYFLTGRAQRIGFIPKDRIERPAPNVISLSERARDRSSKMLRAMFGIKEEPQTSSTSATQSQADDLEEQEVPENAPFVNEEEVNKVIAASRGDLEVQAVARRRLWRRLNDPYREIYRKHRDAGAENFPAFEPSPEQIYNMQSLLALLAHKEDASMIEMAELRRELGDPEGARAMLGEITAQSPPVAQVILECINRGFSGPARYRP
jgi:hypothetical protein